MREFVRAHRTDLDRPTTFFIDLDSVGFGDARFATSAGLGGQLRDGQAPGRAREAIATADAEGESRYRAAAYASGLGGDAVAAAPRRLSRDRDHLPRRRRLRPPTATSPPTRPRRVNHAALDRAHGFALELIRRLDADLGRGESR